MQITTSWERKGMERLLLRLLRERFGSLSAALEQRLDQLTAEQIDELGVAFLQMRSIEQVETWLSEHGV